ncbi:MAG TPA: hypothetical protein VND19_10930 [Acetobacteraceae bacterium]|nr:hypothetical protein [Acetobacteraceae bacterium]
MEDEWGAWGILLAIACLPSAFMVPLTIAKVTDAPRAAWWGLLLSVMPLIAWDIAWAIMAHPSDGWRRVISLAIGAIVGAIVLLCVTELVHEHAIAKPPPASLSPSQSSIPPGGGTSQPPAAPNGASGNFNFDQRGGATKQTYINHGKP